MPNTFNFLQRLDFFSTNVKLYHAKPVNQNDSNRFERNYTKLGSKIGFVFSLIILIFVGFYIASETINIVEGNYDYF